MDIEIPAEQNEQKQRTKVNNTILATFEECKVENRIEQVKTVWASVKYRGEFLPFTMSYHFHFIATNRQMNHCFRLTVLKHC